MQLTRWRGRRAAVRSTAVETTAVEAAASASAPPPVCDCVLLERAKKLLSDPSRRVDDVAQTLCYADRAAFLRAYRRWTGTTPRSAVG